MNRLKILTGTMMLLGTFPPFVQEAKSEEKELTGVVKDQDSQPVTGAHIHLYTLNGAFSYEADTDGNGQYALQIEDCGKN